MPRRNPTTVSNIAPWILGTAVVGVGAYLLWSRRAQAAVTGETLPSTTAGVLPSTSSTPGTSGSTGTTTTPRPTVVTRHPEGVSEQTIRLMQVELDRVGCYMVGIPDGRWGPNTDEAVQCAWARMGEPAQAAPFLAGLTTERVGTLCNDSGRCRPEHSDATP
jgi:hypothetical protein